MWVLPRSAALIYATTTLWDQYQGSPVVPCRRTLAIPSSQRRACSPRSVKLSPN